MIRMSPYFSGILLSYAAAVLGLMSPGPNILAVVGTSMGVNRKADISLALGVSAGALLWGFANWRRFDGPAHGLRAGHYGHQGCRRDLSLVACIQSIPRSRVWKRNTGR